MNRYAVLKTMLPPMIPLLVFIMADEIWGTKVGIIVALVCGIAEYMYIFIKESRSDRFVLADTALLVVLGGISIFLENAVFFKLKPALIEAIFCVILGISVFSDKNLILQMTGRYMKGIEIHEKAVERMRVMLRDLFWIFTLHTFLIVYSAFFMSERAWAFISTALFYIIFGIYFVLDIIKLKYLSRH